MPATTTVGLDIAKSVFQVHGIDARGCVVVRRQLSAGTFAFKKLAPCLSASRHVPRRIIGRASCRLSDTPCV